MDKYTSTSNSALFFVADANFAPKKIQKNTPTSPISASRLTNVECTSATESPTPKSGRAENHFKAKKMLVSRAPSDVIVTSSPLKRAARERQKLDVRSYTYSSPHLFFSGVIPMKRNAATVKRTNPHVQKILPFGAI